jgi:hypothetical protein
MIIKWELLVGGGTNGCKGGKGNGDGRVNIIEVHFIYVWKQTWDPQKMLERMRELGVKKEWDKWGESDQITLHACCKYHNETPLQN